MKQSQLVNAVESGKLLVVGSVVFFKKDVVPYRDKQTGKPATFNKIEYSVVTARGVWFVQPDTRKIKDFDMNTFANPFKNGQRVVVEVESMITEKGQVTVSGNIEPLEA